MFYSSSKNRHKHWYHLLSVGQRKIWALAILGAFLLVACITVLVVYSVRAAGFDMTMVNSGLQGSVLYDSQNRIVANLSARENAPVQWAELPEHLVQAFVAREDAHFFDHRGVVYSALLRSTLRNMGAMRYKQGASTITMQLTRHVFELRGKTLDRKLLEIVLAQRVENNFDKQTILCQYLSRIYFGQSCYGIREAARYYFGKTVSELTLAESAMLAGVVRAPSVFNPKNSMEQATKVRRETLQRMLELEMITQEQYDQAEAQPIVLADASQRSTAAENNSYPVMWANAELEAIPAVRDEQGQGVSVVSHLQLDLQRYTEQAVENALRAIESPGHYPAAWQTPEADTPDAQMKSFAALRRPAWLRAPGAALKPGQATLQCCALVVDSRLNHRGKVLAVVGGRSSADGVDHWQDMVQPGRVAAPLVFCCACLPGGSSHHIVAHSAQITGSRLGYSVVRAFFDGLSLGIELPDAAHANDLYEGRYLLKRKDLARLLFDLQNMGNGYKLGLISAVWSHGQRLIYTSESERAPEYIRRESAAAVSHLPPFQYREGEPTVLHEELAENGGQWTMVFNDRGVAVFVWMGLEGAGSAAPQPTAELRRLISAASLSLAKELHTQTRRALRAPQPAPTPAS